jgi:hypothetical protein
MSTKKKTKSRDPNKIKDSVLDLLPVKIAVDLAVKEFYLNNTDPDTVPRYVITGLRLDFGRVYSRLSEASKLELLALRENNLDNNTKIRIAQMVSDAADISETLPTLEFFEGLDLLPEPDIFFEGLVLAVKNEVLSKQASIFKIKKFRRKLLTDRIRALKENAIENYAEIFRQETILNDIIESELRDELLCYSKFERLNNEKITPYFLKLAQVDTNQHGLDKICDDGGATFPSAEERENYIADFYEQLYKKPIGPERDGQCITEFLSDILDHPAVLDSKLNQDERERLDSDLSISEFDDAIKEIKTNTSPGIDGISNRFIKKFWKLFRCPLFKYATFCLNKGELTENFRSAKVRLIPKKGDPKKISNWRPISLLNCFYKIISRVLTMRLRTVSDKITCIGQKGYSSKKFSQEVLISLLDKIANAKKLNATGCILSLDIKKAFDSLSHNFMRHALSFFNIGDRFINWILTICTNRKSCIIIDNNKTSRNFPLDRGNAQGDVISPYIFNICYQILLLKIELSLQIKKLDLPEPAIPELTGELTGAERGVSYMSQKVFAFADDCNVITTYDNENLDNLINILAVFGEISGLECNIQKTNILIIGNEDNPPVPVPVHAFSVTIELTILGFTVRNMVDNFRHNAEKILDKIKKQIRIWTRYRLSLPGRIEITKSFLYSQLNYMGCVIPVPDDILQKIETEIYQFASGNLRLSKSRVFDTIENGGLGLFNIKHFLVAQTCCWIKRSAFIDQEWKARVAGAGTGNIFLSHCGSGLGDLFPVLKHITDSFRYFITSYTSFNRNFLEGFLLENPALTPGIRTKIPLQMTDLMPTLEVLPDMHRNRLINIKLSDLITPHGKVSKRDFRENFGFQPQEELWTKLDKIRNTAVLRYGSNEGTAEPINVFFSRWKKGSRKVRNYISHDPRFFIPHNMVKYAENTETVIGYELSKTLNKSWNCYFYSNEIRTFIFKLHNNTLPYNTMLSHFVPGITRNCTFCDILLNPDEEDENPLHLFYYCNAVDGLRDDFYKWLLNDENFTVSRSDIFTVFKRPNNYTNRALFVITQLFLKFVWNCKQRKILPVQRHLRSSIILELKTLVKLSNEVRISFLNSGLLPEFLNTISVG